MYITETQKYKYLSYWTRKRKGDLKMHGKQSKRSVRGVVIVVMVVMLAQLFANMNTVTVVNAAKLKSYTSKIKSKYVAAYLRGREKNSVNSKVKCTYKPGTKVNVIYEKAGWSYLDNGIWCKTKYLRNNKKTALKVAKKDSEIFKTTGYCPCKSCSGGYGESTCSGRKAQSNHTIAADLKVLPLYTKVYIKGLGTYEVEDVGGGVRGNHIDIYTSQHSKCDSLTLKRARVYVLKG